MDEVLLTLYCAVSDADGIAMEVRGISARPVHVRSETVYGHDFEDARIAEQVAGTLQRAAVTVVVPAAQAGALIAEVAQVRRAYPVRWVTTPVLAAGRMP